MAQKPKSRIGTRLLHVALPEDLHRRVRVRCAYEDRSIQDYVASLVAEDMKRYKVPGEAQGRRRK